MMWLLHKVFAFILSFWQRLRHQHAIVDDPTGSESLPTPQGSELIEQCRLGNLRAVEALVARGISVDFENSNRDTPLYVASLNGHVEIVSFLLNRGARIDNFLGQRAVFAATNEETIRTLQAACSKSSINTMDDTELLDKLIMACRKGNLNEAIFWTQQGAPLNTPDKQNYTPLVISALCGRKQIVQYLLESGARCDRDTYEGERAIYAALNDEIRDMLINKQHAVEIDPLQPYFSHIASFLEGYSQITVPMKNIWDFEVHGMKVHGIMFALGGCSLPQVQLQQRLEAAQKPVVEDLVQHIYLMRTTTSIDRVLELKELASSLGLTLNLNHELSPKKWLRKAVQPYAKFVDQHVLVKRDHQANNGNAIQEPAVPFSDVSLEIIVDDKPPVIFHAHKFFLIRSEFFGVIFNSSFMEAQSGKLHINAPSLEVAEIVLKHLYCDQVEIPPQLALDTLLLADELLIDRLKVRAVNAIVKENVPPANTSIFAILEAGWELGLERLEHYVASVIAQSLSSYLSDEDFHEAIIQSAKKTNERQETDTIELVDDIRYFHRKHYFETTHDESKTASQVNQNQYESEDKSFDSLLIELGYDI